jgi:hypothetical protein
LSPYIRFVGRRAKNRDPKHPHSSSRIQSEAPIFQVDECIQPCNFSLMGQHRWRCYGGKRFLCSHCRWGRSTPTCQLTAHRHPSPQPPTLPWIYFAGHLPFTSPGRKKLPLSSWLRISTQPMGLRQLKDSST